MPTVLSDRCPKCGRIINYTTEARKLLCPCGHSFLVVEFVSERLKMEKAQEAFAAAKAEKAQLQDRLNGTLTALKAIEDSQKAEDAKLDGIADTLKKDGQTHETMTTLLHVLQKDQQLGQDALSQLLHAMMKEQTDAAGKLSVVQELSTQILRAQQTGAQAMEHMRKETEERIKKLELKKQERDQLSENFSAWSRSMREADVQRLQSLQGSSNALLQEQKRMIAKLDDLTSAIVHFKDAMDSGFGDLRRRRLDKLIALYHQATGLQLERKFDKAEEVYRGLLVEGGSDAQDAEVYWRMLLCHYGVEYQEENGKTIPIILRPDLTDPSTMQVRKNLWEHVKSKEQEAHYTERLKKIDSYLERYRQVRLDPAWAFDVFISVKQNEHGRYTPDSDAASDLYNYFIQDQALAAKKLRVFNSRHTHLPVGEAYEPYIINALMSAKVLIVVGSTPEHMNSQWVKNEWSRFQYLQERERKQGKTERRLFCYLTGGMKPKDLPTALNPDKQVLTEGPTAGGKLRELMDKVFPAPKTARQEPAEQIARRMKAWLKLGEYQQVIAQYKSLLNMSPEMLMEEPWLCLYTLCAQNQFQTIELLARARIDLRTAPLYKIAYERADEMLRAKLDAIWKGSEPSPQSTGRSERIYPDGKYVGQLVNGKRDGRGRMTWKNGDKYDGEWKDDRRSGKGVIYFSDGTKYDGDWRNDERNGKGVVLYANGNIYDGEWRDGKSNGKGVYTVLNGGKCDGERYEGDWKDGKRSGKGILYCNNGDKYDGEWKDGKRSGRGALYYNNGDQYEGDFVNDIRNGTGMLTWKSGNKYEGDWKDDRRTGKGTMTWKDGDKYIGDFVNGIRNGKGVYVWSNGNKYDGDWKDDKRNGKGVLYYNNGDQYEGGFVNDIRNGKGVMTWTNGAKYEGDWKDDKRTGKGVMDYDDGEKYDGDWEDDKRNGKGVQYYNDRDILNRDKYDGEWKDDKRTGKGACFYKNGDKYDGDWKDNERSGKGVFVWKNGDKYNGDFANDIRNGKGVMTWINGAKYEGDWKNNERTGEGAMLFSNGNKYIGEWKNDTGNGYGVYTVADGGKYDGEGYEGEWKDGKRNGKGVLCCSNGDRYEGEWKDGRRCGKGVLYYNNGANAKYDGEWKDGKRNGTGMLTWKNGDKYIGVFANGIRNGKGVYVWRNGDKYDGDWKDDKRNGKGVLYYNNGDQYEGDWKDNKRSGKGVIFFNNGNKYEGDWKDDRRTGKGAMTWKDGDKYIGDFVNGIRNGKGVYVWRNGDKYDGDWKRDVRAGQGVIYYNDGTKYEGEWKDDKRTGKGVYDYANGDRYEGDFLNGALTGEGTLIKKSGKRIPYKDGKRKGFL